MTRINAGFPPKKLHYKHLLAELREIKRIPNSLHKAKLNDLPNVFSLGTGHVRFFYNKGLYLYKRYGQLFEEAKSRGYDVTNFAESWDVYKQPKYAHLFNDWEPTINAKELIEARINERLLTMTSKP